MHFFPVPRLRGVRRRGGLSLLIPALVPAAALAVAGCSLSEHPSTTATSHVLGEPKGTPLAVGQPAPAGTGQLSAVSCATAKRCWAVGVAGPNPAPPGGATVIIATKNGGSTWQAEHVTGGSTPQLSGVSCPTPTQCMAVGTTGASLPGSGVVAVTSDGGATWSTVNAPSSALSVTSVSCATAADCTAIVSQGTVTWSAHTADFGQSWQQEGDLPASIVAGNDLSCTASTCLVAGYVPTGSGHGGGALALSTDGGQTWSQASTPAGIGVLRSVACPSTASCLAAGTTSTTVSDVVPAKGQLLQSTDGGHTWVSATGPTAVDDVYAMACPSAQQCAIVGTKWYGFPAIAMGAVAQSVNGGATFKASPTAYVPITLSSLACPTATHCVAAGGDTVATLTLLQPTHGPGSSSSTGTGSGSSSTSG